MTGVATQIRQFITDNFLFGQGGESLANNDSFLEQGIIDSTGVLELVSFLETQFQIAVSDQEMLPENLDSIDRLVHFIESKLKQAAQLA